MTDITPMAIISDIWVYLSASPLLFLTLTLAAFQAGTWLYTRSGHKPFLNPVLTAVILMVGLLTLSGTTYETYFEGAQFVHFLLGPATVALAIPLYRQFDRVRRSALALITSLICGSLTAIGTATGLGWLMGASRETLISLAPKSVTAPVAMGITEQLGGLPSLTAVMVILTGILGAVLGPPPPHPDPASTTDAPAASPWARRATASAPRARWKPANSPARFLGWPWV